MDSPKIYDFRPRRVSTGLPVLVVPGWCGTPLMYIKHLRALKHTGRRCVSVLAPHGISNSLPAGPYKIPKAIRRKVAAIMYALDETKVERVDVVAHSGGGMYSVCAAAMYPDRFRNLVLANPAGLMGHDTFWRLFGRYWYDTARNLFLKSRDPSLRYSIKTARTEMARSIRSNPARAVADAQALARFQTQDIIQDLRSRGSRIAILHTTDDPIFPIERMKKILATHPVDEFRSFSGDHADFYLKAEQFMAMVVAILRRFEDIDTPA